jgi:cytochrome c biogenesis protein CcdA
MLCLVGFTYNNEPVAPITEIIYAYDTNSSSNDEITKLLEEFYNKYGIQTRKIDASDANNQSIIEKYNSETGVPEAIKNSYPILYIGKKYLFNTDINTSNIQRLLGNGFLNSNFQNISLDKIKKEKAVGKDGVESGKQKLVLYFYSSTCSACKNVEEHIYGLNEKYSDIKLMTYNLYNPENIKLLEAYGKKYNLEESELTVVPAVFIGKSALIGDEEILELLQDKISEYDFNKPTEILEPGSQGENSLEGSSMLQLASIFGAGLMNGFNPCSLSMFLFLLSITVVDRKKILKIGISFCLGKLIMFFLLGTVFYNAMEVLNINLINILGKVFLLLFVAAFALLNLRDSMEARKENYDKMVLQLPSKLKKVYHNLMRKTAKYIDSKYLIIAMLLLGMVLAFGEFLCTGQIYLTSIIVLVQSDNASLMSVIYLLVYSFAFIVPLLAITILMYFGKKTFNLSEVLLEKLPFIKIASSILFIIFGLYIVFLT